MHLTRKTRGQNNNLMIPQCFVSSYGSDFLGRGVDSSLGTEQIVREMRALEQLHTPFPFILWGSF
jgi:hypothetical protein